VTYRDAGRPEPPPGDDRFPIGWDTLYMLGDNDLLMSPGLLVPQPLAVELNGLRERLSVHSTIGDFERAAMAVPKAKWARDAAMARNAAMAQEAARRAAEADEAESKANEPADPDPGALAPDATGPQETGMPGLPGAAQAPEDGTDPMGTRVEVFSSQTLTLMQEKAKSSHRKHEGAQYGAVAKAGQRRLVRLIPGWAKALSDLEQDMPNFHEVLASVRSQCAMAAQTGTPLRITPLLLVGPPGVGKSHFALKLADALELPSFVYSMESAESTSVLLGSERHWSDSHNGMLFRLVLEDARRVANPVIVLDELDKAPSRGSHYRPRDALIPVLERSTSGRLRDKCMEVEFDGSYVIYIATGNAVSPVEAPLLSRFEVHLVRELRPDQAVAVARRMEELVRLQLGLFDFDRPQSDAIQALALLGNPRLFARLIRQGLARAMERGGHRLALRDLRPGGSEGGPVLH